MICEKYLLTKKSATALINKLVNVKQNQKNIHEFGKTIEELFVDLKIAQAFGSSENYKIFKNVNEKQSTQCFANGLTS